MTLTVRSATVTGATTKGSPLTHAELDENWNHVANFTQSGSAVSRTVEGKLQERVSVLDHIPEALHAAIKAGTGTTDLASYIALAVTAAAGKTLLWPAGYYYIAESRIDVTTSQVWLGDGSGCTEIEWAADPTSGDDTSLNVYGPDLVEIGQAPQSIAIGDSTFTFAADPGALSGLIVLRDSAASSFSGFNAQYVAGEIVEIQSQSAETITPKSRIVGVYTASSTFDAFTYSPIKFEMHGITCTFPSDVNIGLRMRRVRDWHLNRCSFTGGALETVEIGEYCYKGGALFSEATNTAAAASDQYGWAITGAQEADMIGCIGTAARHGLQMGGSAIPNRFITITGGHYHLTNEAAGQMAVDCHGNAEWIVFDGVQAEGALLAGDHIKWRGGQITGRSYGIGIRQMLGSDFEIDGADIKVFFANPNSARASGITHESGCMTANTTRGGHLRIRNNTIQYAGATARIGIQFGAESGFAQGAATDVTVENNEVRLTTALAAAVSVLGLTTTAGTFRTIKCKGNRVSGGGFDLRYATATYVDDNDQSGGTDVGALIRNSSTAATDQVAFARRNRFSACAFAGISILGDTSNKFVQVKVEDNDFSAVSATNQGSAANECAVLAQNITTLTLDRNTNPTAGANQTFSYNVVSTVDTVLARDNRSSTAFPLLAATTVIQDRNQWQCDSGAPFVITTAVGNVGGGENDLQTVTLPIGTLAAVKSGIRVTAWGTTANNANPKTVKLLFGGQTIGTTAFTVSQVGKWRIEAIVASTGTDTQDYFYTCEEEGAAEVTDQENGALTVNDGATIVVKCTGTVTDGSGGINNDDIVQEGFIVEPLR